MARSDLSRRWVLTRSLGALGAGLSLPLLASCSDEPPSSLALDSNGADLGSATIDVLLRGSFIPAVDEHTEELVRRWQDERNASMSLDLSGTWREDGRKIARERRGADVAELFGNAPHILADRLVDVSELAERIGDELGGWNEVARSGCVVDGVWRAIPWSITHHGLVTRTDILDDFGIQTPETYGDLLEVASLLDEGGAPPIGLTMGEAGPNDSAVLAYSLLWSFGGQEVDDRGVVAIDSEQTRQALSYFGELVQFNAPGALSYGEAENNDAFLSGQISMTQNASSIYWRAKNVDPTLARSIEHVRLPEGPAGRFLLPELNSLVVFRHSDEQVAALDWIDFVMSSSLLIDRAVVSEAFHVPAVGALDESPKMPWVADPKLAALATSANEGRLPGWPLAPSIEAGLVFENHSIVQMFEAVGSGAMSPNEAARTAADELRRVYET